MRLAEKERTYLTPIQSENDFNLNSKTFEYSVGILSIVIYVRILLVQETLYLLKYILLKKQGRDLNSHLHDGFIVLPVLPKS